MARTGLLKSAKSLIEITQYPITVQNANMDIIYQIRHSQNVLDIPNTEYVPMKGDVLLSSDGKYYEVISRFYSVTGDFLSVIVSPIVI